MRTLLPGIFIALVVSSCATPTEPSTDIGSSIPPAERSTTTTTSAQADPPGDTDETADAIAALDEIDALLADLDAQLAALDDDLTSDTSATAAADDD